MKIGVTLSLMSSHFKLILQQSSWWRESVVEYVFSTFLEKCSFPMRLEGRYFFNGLLLSSRNSECVRVYAITFAKLQRWQFYDSETYNLAWTWGSLGSSPSSVTSTLCRQTLITWCIYVSVLSLIKWKDNIFFLFQGDIIRTYETELVKVLGTCQKKDDPQIPIIVIQHYIFHQTRNINKNNV